MGARRPLDQSSARAIGSGRRRKRPSCASTPTRCRSSANRTPRRRASDADRRPLPAQGLEATLPECARASRQGRDLDGRAATFGGAALYTPPAGRSSAEQVQRCCRTRRGRRLPPHRRPRAVRDGSPIECDLLLCGADAVAKETWPSWPARWACAPSTSGALSNAGPARGHHRGPRHDQSGATS